MQVITGGPRTFSAIAFQNQHPDNQNYFAQKLQDLRNTFGDSLNEVAGGFMANAGQLFDKFYGSDAMRAARGALRKVKSLWDRDDIRELFNITELQQAKPVMQRWNMAEPTYRKLYHQQICDGYSGSYVDMEPGVVGEAHYDYRRVTDGLMVDHEDEDGEGWMMTHYIEDLKEGDADLEIEDVGSILSCWELIKMHTKKREEDPLSPLGGKM